MTDYLLAENLRLAYEDPAEGDYRADNADGSFVMASYHSEPAGIETQTNRGSGESVVLKPEVKQMIADEVKSVIAEQQQAANAAPGAAQATLQEEPLPALDPKHRVFVAFAAVEATANGEACALTASDVIQRVEDTPDASNTVAARILASKNADCAVGSQVRIVLSDLTDMQNHLREQVDAGMKILAEKQGKDGLPPAPAANPRAVPEGTAAPDPAAAADLRKQLQEADETEKEVQEEASPNPSKVN